MTKIIGVFHTLVLLLTFCVVANFVLLLTAYQKLMTNCSNLFPRLFEVKYESLETLKVFHFVGELWRHHSCHSTTQMNQKRFSCILLHLVEFVTKHARLAVLLFCTLHLENFFLFALQRHQKILSEWFFCFYLCNQPVCEVFHYTIKNRFAISPCLINFLRSNTSLSCTVTADVNLSFEAVNFSPTFWMMRSSVDEIEKSTENTTLGAQLLFSSVSDDCEIPRVMISRAHIKYFVVCISRHHQIKTWYISLELLSRHLWFHMCL